MNRNQTVKITKNSYKGWPSTVMETEQLRAEIIPELGAKIVSLCYKPTGREWLVDSGSRELRQPVYGSPFTQADMSGWDEVFPTVDPCIASGYGYGLDKLPDHGDVWALSWDAEVSGTEVSCSVKGLAGPYRLTRTLCFQGMDCLQMNYRLTNDGQEPLPFMWVPHPQFWVSEPTRVIVPGDAAEMLCVYGGASRQTGQSYPVEDLSLVQAEQTGDGRKYYVSGVHREGWCALVGVNTGDWLKMRTDPEQVPFLGVWIDEGLCNDRNVIALEPSIGYYDCLERAIGNRTAQVVQPGQAWDWSLRVQLGTGEICQGL